MALALNNLKRVDMPLNKETNQPTNNQKDNPCTVSHTWKKTVANDRAGIKHITLKFRGPVGLGGMNKWWKNEFLKEHWPKSWMCSSHVVMVFYCSWNCQEESVKKRGRGNDTQPFILPEKVTWAEWHQSFSLDEIYRFKTPMAKTIPTLNNN